MFFSLPATLTHLPEQPLVQMVWLLATPHCRPPLPIDICMSLPGNADQPLYDLYSLRVQALNILEVLLALTSTVKAYNATNSTKIAVFIDK